MTKETLWARQKPPRSNIEDKKEGLTEQCTAKGKKGE